MATKKRERGRKAERPRDIPASGWGDVLRRVNDRLGKDHISIVAAGVAFYGMMAIFPALAALVSIYALVADPADIQNQMSAVQGVMPEEVYSTRGEPRPLGERGAQVADTVGRSQKGEQPG